MGSLLGELRQKKIGSVFFASYIALRRLESGIIEKENQRKERKGKEKKMEERQEKRGKDFSEEEKGVFWRLLARMRGFGVMTLFLYVFMRELLTFGGVV